MCWCVRVSVRVRGLVCLLVSAVLFLWSPLRDQFSCAVFWFLFVFDVPAATQIDFFALLDAFGMWDIGPCAPTGVLGCVLIFGGGGILALAHLRGFWGGCKPLGGGK